MTHEFGHFLGSRPYLRRDTHFRLRHRQRSTRQPTHGGRTAFGQHRQLRAVDSDLPSASEARQAAAVMWYEIRLRKQGQAGPHASMTRAASALSIRPGLRTPVHKTRLTTAVVVPRLDRAASRC